MAYLYFRSHWKIWGRKWSLWLHYEPPCALSCVVNAVFSLRPVTNRTYLSWHSKDGKIGKYSRCFPLNIAAAVRIQLPKPEGY